jgi:hypothetical protein
MIQRVSYDDARGERRVRGPVWGVSGALLAVGVVLAVIPALFRLDSTSCGPIGCDVLQTAGKVLACVAVLSATGAIAARGLVQRNYTIVGLVFLIALPAAIFAGLALMGDDAEAQRTNQIARTYAAAQLGRPAEQLRPIILDGKLGWIAVRVTDSAGGSNTVLLQKSEGEWRPRALAPSFGKEQLRALGAPTDLIRES